MEGIQYGIQQGYNPIAAPAYGSQPYGSQFGQPQFSQPQFGQQGSFGAFGNPLSGLLGSGIAGLLSAQNLGRQPMIDGAGGMIQAYANPYGNIDPMTAAHVQQAQLAQQLAQQQLGRTTFGMDPIAAAVAQQRGLFGQQGYQTPWLGMNPMSRIDPVTAAYIQQAQIAQLFQQLALQSQLGQQGQFGHQMGHGQLGQAWLGGGQNLWANSQLGRGLPLHYGAGVGYGSQLPIY